MEVAVNEDSDIYGVHWVGQVELYTRTAHWDVSRVEFSGSEVACGSGCTLEVSTEEK